ncbi:phosphoribosyltransferase family protein [Bremerella sp. JC770]|uniref:ComF family protein n=1 Tax=Bremerella sp. JC770 TaxID=3232137 RepID=UPI00345A65D4
MPSNSLFSTVHHAGRSLAGLLLPGCCCLCADEVIHYRAPDVLCPQCEQKRAEAKRCVRCSAVLSHENALPSEDCPACHHLKLPFAEITSVGNYEDRLREAVLSAKSNRGMSAAWDLGQLLTSSLEASATNRPCIVPVPMHWTRRLRRGTNTALILAQSFARKTGWPVERLVVCRQAMAKQSELPITARQKNVRNAFAVKDPISSDRPIVLVDDIMTTGATLTELARVLRQAGAAEIRVAVVARSTPQYLNV